MYLSPEILLYYRENPDIWLERFIKVKLDPIQRVVIRDVFHCTLGKYFNDEGEQIRQVSLCTCHGAGKTTTCALTAIAFISLFPNARVMVVAPTYNQVINYTLNEIKKWLDECLIAHEFELFSEKITVKGKESKWFIFARAGEDQTKVEGLHAQNVLVIIDEAKGVKDPIFDAILGAMTTRNAAALNASTPGMSTGRFFESQTKLRNKIYKCHTLNAFNSPRVKKSYIDNAKRIWGESSAVYKMKVLGQFPDEAENQLFSLLWLERAHKNAKVKILTNVRTEIGADVAGEGADSSVFASRKGNHLKRLMKRPEKVRPNVIARYLRDFCLSHDDADFVSGDDLVKIDDTGIGGEVTNLMEGWGFNVIPIKTGIKAVHDPYHFALVKDEMYWFLRMRFMNEEISLDYKIDQFAINGDGFDNEMIDQALKLQYEDNGKVIRILDGRNAPKRVGTKKSPDIMDAYGLAFYPIEFMMEGARGADSMNQEFEEIFEPPIPGEIYL